MPPDPEFVAETRSWLTKADHDLKAAEVLRRAQPSAMKKTIDFHCGE